VNVGDKVPVALAPTKVGELKVEKVKLRGIKSYGMICSNEELGIEDGGLPLFDKKIENGTDINKIFGGDTVLDIDLTPNRPDCFSVIGMARETSASLDTQLKISEPKKVQKTSKKKIKVEIKDKDLCSRYICKVIENVKIKPSPKWMQNYLISAGVRPINNIVDVTNYVMLEWGQPLHAFDMDKIQGDKITIRKAKNGERMETLDSVMRSFNTEDLLISDSVGPIAVAGVMGGASSEVINSTKNMVLEAANFDRGTIRKTAQKLRLRSESSSRFEKGLPVKLQEIAIERAAELILKLAGGSAGENIDIMNQKDSAQIVNMSLSKFEKFLGFQISEAKIVSILTSLGFDCKKSANVLAVKVPWWRLDISIEEDLFEEVARIYGYNNLPSKLPSGELTDIQTNKKLDLTSEVKDILAGAGFSEVINYSFTSEEVIGLLDGNVNKHFKISNPISSDMEYLRTSLAGSLLGNIKINQDNFSNINVFEIANIYQPDKKGIPVEKTLLSIALSSNKKDGRSFFEMKGMLELIFKKLNITNYGFIDESINILESGRSATITINNKKTGFLGEMNEKIKRQFGIKDDILMLEIDIKFLLEDYGKVKKYQPFPKFPASERDLTFTLDEKVKISEIEQVICSVSSKIRAKTEIVDIYRGKGLPGGKKSVSIRFIYQSMTRTLTDREVDDDQKKIIKEIQKSLGGHLRSEGSQE
jgi:phenylalanyl-tRNA synthetase beta chain